MINKSLQAHKIPTLIGHSTYRVALFICVLMKQTQN